MDITDVRKALWNAYKKLEKTEGSIEGKSSEGWVQLHYPTYWDCATEEEFQTPDALEIYGYALGPSRMHYIRKGEEDKQISPRSWESPDIFTKAVEVIKEWESKI